MAMTELVDVYTRKKEWIYFGGGKHVTRFDVTKLDHWKKFCILWPTYFEDKPVIAPEEKCVCNTKIQQQCWILNTESLEIVVIGNCCIRKFKLTGMTCSRCKAVHRNRKDNFCNSCRPVIKKEQLIQYRKDNNLCVCGNKKKYPTYPKCMQCWWRDKKTS
tara:strand:- start:652 stop:1131 length:480 start_codon:yes stop_codon:yes gene_type:complete